MAAKEKQFKPLKSVSEELGFGDVTFPIAVSLKMDGVYGVNHQDNFLGRSLKPMKNTWLTETFSKEKYKGIVGEMCYADIRHMEADYVPEDGEEYLGLNRQDLCRASTSKVNTINGGEFPLIWVLFDYVYDSSEQYCYGTGYVNRMTDLANTLDEMPNSRRIAIHEFAGFYYYEYMVDGHTFLVAEGRVANNAEELEALYDAAIEAGFEGIVGRNLGGVFKFGRSTAKSQELVRFKPSGDSEIVVVKFEPMFENNNEAKINEVGETERSSHKENKVQLEMVGSMVGIDVNSGKLVTVGAGKMNHAERAEVWLDRENRLGVLSKYKFMATGEKDLPRHPRHYMFRAASDMEFSEEVLAKLEELGIKPQ